MTAPASHPALAIPQASLQAMVPQRPTPMRVSLAFVEHRVNVYLRSGSPFARTYWTVGGALRCSRRARSAAA